MKKNILLVTGVSGSGRTTVNQVLTDEGYIILENLTTELLEKMVNVLIEDKKSDKIAIVLNVRNIERFARRFNIIQQFASDLVDVKSIMLVAKESVLVNRYQESRKVHPLSKRNPQLTLAEAIKLELEVAAQVTDQINFVLDTSALSAKDTKAIIRNFLNVEKFNFTVNLQSFGFKYGMPTDSDLVFDVRFLPNPFYDIDLRSQSGLDKPVRDFVFSNELANTYYNQVKQVIETAIQGYQSEGRLLVNISIGCTGGQHRSVSYVERLAEELNQDFIVTKHIEGSKGHWHK